MASFPCSKAEAMRKALIPAIVLAAALASAVAAARAEPASTAAHAKLGAWGVDLSTMDTRVRPQDDFFRYVNGRWYDTYQFKPDETYVGARPNIFALRHQRVLSLI